MKHWLLGMLGLLVGGILLLLGLCSSTSGSRWLLQHGIAWLPGEVSVQQINGRLLGRIELADLRYKSASEQVSAKRLIVEWRPQQLFNGHLHIVEISVDQVKVMLQDRPEPKENFPPFDANAPINLPLRITLEQLLLTDVQVEQHQQSKTLQRLQVAAYTRQQMLTISTLELIAQPLSASLNGTIGLGQGFPLQLQAAWGIVSDAAGTVQATTRLDGDLTHLRLATQLTAPFKADLHGDIQHALDAPQFAVTANWQQLHWPFTAQPAQLSSEHGKVSLNGSLQDYRLSLEALLSQPTLPTAQLNVTGQGNTEALKTFAVTLASSAGTFKLDGAAEWHEALAFSVNARGEQFNPAIMVPELPGQISFAAHIKGRQQNDTLTLDANIDPLKGTLRNNPVSAQGHIALTGERVQVDDLQLRFGANELSANGTLGATHSGLNMAINAPQLQAFWPGLNGNIKGDGLISGAWDHPSVKLQVNTKALAYAEQRVQQLALNLDYHANARQASLLRLSATNLQANGLRINKVLLNGDGRLAEHRFNAEVTAPQATLKTSLTGSIKQARWQSELSTLTVSSQRYGNWMLKQPVAVQLAKTAEEVNGSFSEFCLLNPPARLCSQGRKEAQGELQAEIRATELPTVLLQGLLPPTLQVDGVINANVQMQQQKGQLSGRYQLAMPAHTKLTMLQAGEKAEFRLGELAIRGQLQQTEMTTDLDLDLLQQDYVHAAGRFNTQTQALAGNLNASIKNFELLKPFIPATTTVKGALSAELTVHGVLQQPEVDGSVRLQRGTVLLAEQGIGVEGLELRAMASGSKATRLQLQGSATPYLLNSKDSSAPPVFKSMLTLTADVQQRGNVFDGEVQVDMPARTTLHLTKTDDQANPALGPLTLKANIERNAVAADLTLALMGQDYVRAKVNVDNRPERTVQGNLQASVLELAPLSVFLPHVAKLEGRMQSNLALSGRLNAPDISGTFNLSNGSAEVIPLGIRLEAIQLQVLASADQRGQIKITGSAKSGQGVLQLRGSADVPAATAGLTLTGNGVELMKLPEAQVTVSPDLRLAYAAHDAQLSGKLSIPTARLQLQDIPENAITVSPDEIIIGETEETPETTVPTQLGVAIDVNLGKDIKFTGQGLTTNLSGVLKITKAGEKLAMYGNVDMTKARFKRFGQDLTVRKGQFLFNGPVDKPWLDLEAIRLSKSQEVTAILTLSGPLDAPQTRISSEPVLSESDALAYLVTGRPLSQVSKSEGNVLASAAIAYGSGQASWLADKLGVDEFEVKEGKTLQDTLVAVGQYLTPDFYVGTKVGLFNKQAVLVLKHKLTDKLNVETQAGTSQRVKLNYEFDTD